MFVVLVVGLVVAEAETRLSTPTVFVPAAQLRRPGPLGALVCLSCKPCAAVTACLEAAPLGGLVPVVPVGNAQLSYVVKNVGM